jgi:hypothetical protein
MLIGNCVPVDTASHTRRIESTVLASLACLFVMTEGDWEEDHEKLAEITEQSRIPRNSYNNDTHIDSDDHTDLDLEASISQLVLEDCDDPIVENGEATKPEPLV